MVWERLHHGSITANGNTGSFTPKTNMRVILNIKNSGNIQPELTCGTGGSIDTGNNYTTRGFSSDINSSDYTRTSQDSIETERATNGNMYLVFDVTNVSNQEKLFIGHVISAESAGAGNSPVRWEIAGKGANTSGQINIFGLKNTQGGSIASGSTITVLGASSDVTTDEKTTISNIPANTRYEETDTRKIYRWKQAPLEPVFHYKFSESSGDVINHGSVASADLTVTSLTRDQSTPSGLGNGMKTTAYNTGYAQNTSRVNDYKFLHDGTSKWSITFWLKAGDTPTDSTSTERMVFGNIWTDDNGIGFCIRLAKNSDNSSSVCRIQTLIADGDSGMPLNDQTPDGMMPDVSNWHFYCITYDPTLSSNNLTVSRDATTSGTGFHQGDYDDVAYSTSNPTRKTTYFARPTSSYDHGIVGTLAQVMIFKDVILSQANKESLYASGNGTTTIPDSKEWVERGTA